MNLESPPDQAQKAPIPWRIYGLIGTVALLIALAMGYSLRTGNRMAARYTPLIDAVMEIKLEATRAHLWIEEIVSGDRHLDIAMVWQHLDAATWYANAMLEGGENQEGTFIPLEDPQLRYKIIEVLRLLGDFKEVVEERFLAQEGTAAPGTDIDQRFDSIFADFLQHADEVETRLQQLIRADLRWFNRVQVILIFIILGLAVFTGFVLYRFERQRAASYLAAKKAEHAARESEERLQLTFEGADLGLWDWNILTGEVHFNKSWVGMLGYALDEIEPHIDTWMKLVHPDDVPQVEQVLNAHLEGKTPYYETEHRMRAKSGEWKWILDRGKVFTRDQSGKPVRAVGTHLGITERHQAEEALLESAARIRAIVDTAASGIVVINEEGIVENFNRGAEQIFGYTADEVIGHRVNMLMPQPYNHEHDGYIKNYIKTGKRKVIGIGREVEGLRKDGSTFPMHLSVSEVPLTNRTLFTGIVLDITESKQAEEELRQARNAAQEANQAKSEFLAKMSHELRTPLNSVIGFANVLAKNKGGHLGEKELTFIERITDNGRHLLDLINDILDLSKVEAGKLELELSRVGLDQMATDTVAQMEGQVRGKKVKLVTEIPPKVKEMQADEAKLKQVLINLLGNALKFTEKGSITVSVLTNPETNRPERIEVKDTGIGIPEDRLTNIFEAFQQAESGTSRQYGGTGLGLAISRSLCELMGYQLTVSSEEGKGSTFSIILTERKAEQAAQA